MAVNRALFERVVRDLLVVRGGHLLEVYEGSGSSWQRAKCALVSPRCMPRRWGLSHTPLSTKWSLQTVGCTGREYTSPRSIRSIRV